MPTEVMRERFARAVAELVERNGFLALLPVIGVADDGSMFGVRFEGEAVEIFSLDEAAKAREWMHELPARMVPRVAWRQRLVAIPM